MALKKVLSLILSLSIVSSLIGVIPVSAESGYDYFIEAENYSDSNWRSTGGGRVQSKAVYSNGKYLNLFYEMGDVGEYYTEYKIECQEAGVYAMDIASTPLRAGWSSPIYVSVNGGEQVLLVGTSFQSITGDSNVKWYHTGVISLDKGSNVVRFSVREGRTSDGKATCYFDWFGLTKTQYSLREIKSPAPLQTFQQGEKLEFEIFGMGLAPEDMPISYDVLDFEGKYVDGGNTVLKKNTQTVKFELKSKKNGAYQIIANCNGQSIVQQFLVVTNLKDRKKLEDSPFGLDALIYGMRNSNGAELAEEFADMLELTGITWIRDRVYFDNYVTKDGDNFTFKMPHTKITGDLLAERGIKVLQTMNYSPPAIRPSTDYGDVLPTNLFDVYNFWKQLAEYYDGSVACWEIQNEADLGGGGSNKDGADAYSSMFKAAALGIMDSNTKNEVYVSPFGAAAQPYHSSQHVELMFENDIYDYTNVTNYHKHRTATEPYDKYFEFGKNSIKTTEHVVEGYLDLCEENGFTQSQWNSESGISIDVPQGTDYDAEEQMVQAKYLVTSYAEDLAAGTDKKFFFDGISYQEGAKSWGMASRSATSPSAYAAYGTLSAMTHVLGEGVYLGKLIAPEGVSAYAFKDGEDTAIVYYSTSLTGEKYNFTVNTGKMSVRHFDIFANEDKVYSQSGMYSLTAKDCPQYIKFTGKLSSDSFTDDVVDEYIPIGDEQKSVDAGKRVVILQKYDMSTRTNARLAGYNLDKETNGVDVEVFNFNDFPVSGVINGKSDNGWQIEPASQPIEIAPMTSVTVRFEVIPDPFMSQEDRITFYGDMDCGKTSDSVTRVLGAQVVDFQPKIADGEKFVTVRINNSSDIEKVVKKTELVVNGNENVSTEAVVIEPKTVGTYDIPTTFSDTEKTLDIEAKIEFTDGTKASHSGETAFAIAKKSIGDLSETPSFILPDDGTIKTPYYYGEDDLYGEFYVGADEENFYFAGKVKDNFHSAPSTGYDIWRNDGIQFAIGKGLPSLTTPYYELGCSLTDSGVSEAYYWADPDKTGNGKLEGVECKITRDESTKTTTYYMAIPWSVIPRISYEDGMLAFSMLINENDGAGRNGYLEWGSGIGSKKDPSQFRTIVFDK